jgi:hypothetical protein
MEIDQMFKGEDLAMHISSMSLRWLGHIERMQDGRMLVSSPWPY